MALTPSALHAQSDNLRVGAAKVDVTPAPKELTQGYLGILDPLYVRAIAIESGQNRAALVTIDAGVIPTDIWQRVSRRAERD